MLKPPIRGPSREVSALPQEIPHSGAPRRGRVAAGRGGPRWASAHAATTIGSWAWFPRRAEAIRPTSSCLALRVRHRPAAHPGPCLSSQCKRSGDIDLRGSVVPFRVQSFRFSVAAQGVGRSAVARPRWTAPSRDDPADPASGEAATARWGCPCPSPLAGGGLGKWRRALGPGADADADWVALSSKASTSVRVMLHPTFIRPTAAGSSISTASIRRIGLWTAPPAARGSSSGAGGLRAEARCRGSVDHISTFSI